MAYKIKYYLTTSGHSDVLDAYRKSHTVRAEFDVHLEYLKVRSREEWRRPKAAKLIRDVADRDFFEIRIFADKVQQRPIGYFGPLPSDFTVVLWATEKGGKIIPETWNNTSSKRKKQIKDGSAFTEFFYDEDKENEKI